MKTLRIPLIITIITIFTVSCVCAITADHTSVPKFSTIPSSVILQARNQFDIFYGHTSHGSQIVTGMDMIYAEDTLYHYNGGAGTLSISEYGSDLGWNGDTAWVTVTRQQLNQPGNTINMVMWSWCGGVSGNDEAGINIYLNAMNQLEHDYPNVRFIYMTGHLDGSGPTGTLYVRNNQIRTYCALNNKILFDFADIESYDPNGTYYPDGADDCAWCSSWCASHSCPDCSGCAHSHCFNCYLKGHAIWWLLARLTGWEDAQCCEGRRGDIDGSGEYPSEVDISDLSSLVDYLTGGSFVLPCSEEANIDGSSVFPTVDISDLSSLVNYLTGGSFVIPNCP
jgi:hypothetical protein